MKLFSRMMRKPDASPGTLAQNTSLIETTLSREGDELVFTATNHGNEPARFCVFMTPFEGFRGDILEVIDSRGTPMEYLGIQIKRKPPEERHFMTLAPSEARRTAFVLSKEYGLTGQPPYTVRFKGTPDINGLADSNLTTS
ncbi:MAG TPA: hypothetical protein PK095_05160 [Myxococcota bacterium]|nr:hypothetical protein [Myxococcota bacterium]